jgi:hypothetical protein
MGSPGERTEIIEAAIRIIGIIFGDSVASQAGEILEQVMGRDPLLSSIIAKQLGAGHELKWRDRRLGP